MELFILDANGTVCADFRGPGDTIRARGWGWIQYIPERQNTGPRCGPEAETIFDAWAAFLAHITMNRKTKQEALKALNDNYR